MLFEHIYKEISFAFFRVGKLILYESIANNYSRKAIILVVEYYVDWAFITVSVISSIQ